MPWKEYDVYQMAGSKPGPEPHRLPARQERKLIARVRANVPYRDIQEEFGCSINYIKGAMVRHGIPNRPQGRRKLTPTQEKRLLDRVRAGAKYREIEEEFDCTVSTIRGVMRRHGVPLRSTGAPRLVLDPKQIDQMVEMYTSGLSQAQIAKKIGISQPMISLFLNKAGVTSTRRLMRHCHPNWKGGRTRNRNSGYIHILVDNDHPFVSMLGPHGRYVLEHRLVMAQHLGRALQKHETVHHINGNHADNRIENLELRVGRHGVGASGAHCVTCTCFKGTMQ